MLGHTTDMLIMLPNTGSVIVLATDICPTKDIALCVFVTPRVERDEVRHEIRQRRTVVAPMRSATAIVATHDHLLLGNKLDVTTRGLESHPNARTLLFRVATFAADITFIAYATCELRATRALCGAVATLATASTLLVHWTDA
jgi:hypothetical protein